MQGIGAHSTGAARRLMGINARPRNRAQRLHNIRAALQTVAESRNNVPLHVLAREVGKVSRVGFGLVRILAR